MSRTEPRARAEQQERLTPQRKTCIECSHPMWVAYHAERTVLTLQGLRRLTLVVRRCRNQECPRYHQPYRPEEEGRWALPHGEYGLDVIALVGMLRYRHHHSLAELHH